MPSRHLSNDRKMTAPGNLTGTGSDRTPRAPVGGEGAAKPVLRRSPARGGQPLLAVYNDKILTVLLPL